MSELEISTSGLVREVKARIDGHVFTIRKLGAGSELDIQRKSAKMATVAKQAFNLKSKIDGLSKTEDGYTEEMIDELESFIEKMGKAQDELAQSYMNLFDDGTDDQKYTKRLLDKYGVDGLRELNARAFKAEESNDQSA